MSWMMGCLMIVRDFDGGDNDLVGVPNKADSPLLVDADAPLALATAAELFGVERRECP
jgi:hypothetical protein